MTDNQQQQMNIEEKRSAGEIVGIGAGLGIVGLGFLFGLKLLFPDAMDDAVANMVRQR